MIITYKVHRSTIVDMGGGKHHCDKYIIHSVNTNEKIGKDVKKIFQDNNRFYVGGIYAGCEILNITDNDI